MLVANDTAGVEWTVDVGGLVKGVAWDPRGELIAVQCETHVAIVRVLDHAVVQRVETPYQSADVCCVRACTCACGMNMSVMHL